MVIQVFGDVAVDPERVRVVSKVPLGSGVKHRSSLLVAVDNADNKEDLVLVSISEYGANELLKHFRNSEPQAESV